MGHKKVMAAILFLFLLPTTSCSKGQINSCVSQTSSVDSESTSIINSVTESINTNTQARSNDMTSSFDNKKVSSSNTDISSHKMPVNSTSQQYENLKKRLSAFDLDLYLTPYWKGNIIYHESLMFIEDEHGSYSSKLMFEPDEIISVQNSHLTREFTLGVDYTVEKGTFTLTKDSNIPSIYRDVYYPKVAGSNTLRLIDDSGNLLLMGGSFFHDKQISVTYTHKDHLKTVPPYQGDNLPRTIQKLQNKQDLKMVFFGDSITAGGDSSALSKVAPMAPIWPDMFKMGLEKAYHTKIESYNTAVGGMVSEWGKQNAEEKVAQYNPDIVVLAFGMNDGSWNVSPAQFSDNIQSIMQTVRAKNPSCEFILVSSILPSKEPKFDAGNPVYGNQALYPDVLHNLAGSGTVVADVTAVYKEILQHKRFSDMTGNNVNHPNDFLARLYAQVLMATTVKDY